MATNLHSESLNSILVGVNDAQELEDICKADDRSIAEQCQRLRAEASSFLGVQICDSKKSRSKAQ